MKNLNWSSEKNEFLKKARGISFEEIEFWLTEVGLIEIVYNPSGQFQHQKMLIVNVNNYVHIVPFVETEEEYFLKTIFPSRKATKKYLE